MFCCIRDVRLNDCYDLKVAVAKEMTASSIGVGGLEVNIIYYVVVVDEM